MLCHSFATSAVRPAANDEKQSAPPCVLGCGIRRHWRSLGARRGFLKGSMNTARGQNPQEQGDDTITIKLTPIQQAAVKVCAIHYHDGDIAAYVNEWVSKALAADLLSVASSLDEEVGESMGKDDDNES